MSRNVKVHKRLHTKRWIIFRNMGVRPNGLVLPVHQDPEANLALGEIEVLRYSDFEDAVSFLLEDPERRKLGRRPVLLVKGSQVEALVLTESVIGDNLCRDQMI
jgi:hypothetical protein